MRIKMKEEEKEAGDKSQSECVESPLAFAYEKAFLSNYFTPRTTKRGRFTIEDYSGLERKFEISKEYKKGRFHVIETKPIKKDTQEKDLLRIIELQNKQINLLYTILRRSNEEFGKTSSEIEDLFKRFN